MTLLYIHSAINLLLLLAHFKQENVCEKYETLTLVLLPKTHINFIGLQKFEIEKKIKFMFIVL